MRSPPADATRPRDRQQIVVGPCVEQRVFGQRARRHQPHHVAAHDAFVAAGARRGRVLHLLADRDPMALRDQAMQIVVGALHRHAAHRDIRALMLAALGQHDAERAWRRFRHPRRTARRNRPSGRTAAGPGLAALISRYCSIIGVTRAAAQRRAGRLGRRGMSAGSSSRRFRVKWGPVRVKKTHQNEKSRARFRSNQNRALRRKLQNFGG